MFSTSTTIHKNVLSGRVNVEQHIYPVESKISSVGSKIDSAELKKIMAGYEKEYVGTFSYNINTGCSFCEGKQIKLFPKKCENCGNKL